MPLPPRRPGRLATALVLAAAVGCGGLPTEKPKPGSFTPVTVEAQAASATPGFADQVGEALLVDPDGAPVRIRLDGTRGPLESHPANPSPPGKARAVLPLGPHLALVPAENGLYVAQGGWLIAAPWGAQLPADGLRGATDAGDGSAWIAHETGLFRLKDGTLSELKVSGRSVGGLVGVAAARAEDGVPGVWFAHEGGLSVVVSTTAGLKVRAASLPGSLAIQSLAALGDSPTAPGELWVLTRDGALLRNAVEGWRRYDLGGKVGTLAASGRVAWVTVGDPGQRLLRFDADTETWEEASGFDIGPALLAADASGAAWIRKAGDGSNAVIQVSRARTPRIHGLDQNMRISDGELVVRAILPPGPAPTQVLFRLDDVLEVNARPPLYSLGGEEGEERPRAYSFVGLTAGMHTLKVNATYADGTAAERVVPFAFQPLSQEVPGWERDIRPIHEARCAKCHVSGPGPDLSTYELWRGSATVIVNVLRERRMPADGPLEPELILKVQRWVQGGLRP